MLKEIILIDQGISDYQELKNRLQIGRKFNRIRRRAVVLGVLDGSRTKEWQAAGLASEQNWGERNPDVLYLEADADIKTLTDHGKEFDLEGMPPEWDNGGEWVTCSRYGAGDGSKVPYYLPYEVLRGVQILLNQWDPSAPTPHYPNSLLLIKLGKPLERSIPGLLDLSRECAGRQLVNAQVKVQALTAVPSSRTPHAATIALIQIFV